MQIIYDTGPRYHVNDYFPHFHYQAGASLAAENYDLLTEYWGTAETIRLEELETRSDAVEKLAEEGAVENFPNIFE